MNKFAIFWIFSVLLLLPAVNAEKGHMRLLAVTETSNGDVGGIADLFLEIKKGSGRVFLETFPVTKVDTQISTRFAKEIACDFADVDCSKFDFFYTIIAGSSIIGGPSAGAAITILTFSLIEGVNLDDNVAITGTINSGGVIGPVGGVDAKIEAAGREGISKVLIPIGDSFNHINETENNESINQSLDINESKEEFKIEVKEVATLDEALFEFTGKRFREKKVNLTISENYKDTMKDLAVQLCSRSTKLKNRILNFTKNDNATKDTFNNAVNLSGRGKESFQENKFYSSASYCFGSNVEFNRLTLVQLNLTEDEVQEKIDELTRDIDSFDLEMENRKLKTITDLESYMIVKERLIEASEFVDLVIESIEANSTNLRNLAYAMERLNSAKSWAEFLENKGKEFDLNDQVIESACRTKLSEVEERLQYVQLYFPQNLDNTRKELEYAYQDLEQGNFELCLFKASKAKANVNTVLSVFGVRTDNVRNVADKKLEIVERNLVEETEKGVFPVVGYSYYEYANSLKENDPFSALLYSEYALELSNLEIYFKSPAIKNIDLFGNIDKKLFIVLIVGIILGFFIGKITKFNVKKRKRKKSDFKPHQSRALVGKKR